MERFGLKISDEELKDLIEGIEDYDPKPIFVDKDGDISFHPYILSGEEIIVCYSWKHKRPVTVYRRSWFYITSDGSYHPVSKNYKRSAKERRLRDKRRGMANKSPHKEKQAFIESTLDGW